MCVAFWRDYAAKSEFRFNAFSKKNQLFPVTIKIISDIQIEFWPKKGNARCLFCVIARQKDDVGCLFREESYFWS